MLPIQYLELRKSRRLGELLNLTFQYLRENSRTLMKSLLYIAGPAVLLTGTISGTYIFGLSSVFGLKVIVSPFLGMMLGMVLGLITYVLVQGIANQHVRLYLERSGGEISVDDVWQAIKQDFWRMFGAALSVGAILGIAFFLYAYAVTLGSGFGFLAFMVIAIPAIYISVPLSLVMPASIQDRMSISQAFSRGFAVVRKNWWNTVGLTAALSGVAFVISSVFLIPMLMVISFSSLFSTQSGSGRESILYAVCTILLMTLSYLVSFLPTLGLVLQYYNLVEKVDAVGILARIATIGQHDDEPEHRSFLS